jgi:ABC-type lipoprotein export system ATPase subunit
MTITLDHIIPIPLRDKLASRPSDIWNTSISFAEGEWIKINAPSGTGKTTLVHIIWQLRKDFTGKVFYDNKSAADISANAMADYRQQKLSVIFQDMRLFANLTARENIELKRQMNGKPFYDTSMIDAMAAALGVSHIMNQDAATCSYGEQQRIAIIRSLMQPFKWLIMDEPFSHLDRANTRKAAALIAEECRKRNAGFLLTDLDADDHSDYTKQLSL